MFRKRKRSATPTPERPRNPAFTDVQNRLTRSAPAFNNDSSLNTPLASSDEDSSDSSDNEDNRAAS